MLHIGIIKLVKIYLIFSALVVILTWAGEEEHQTPIAKRHTSFEDIRSSTRLEGFQITYLFVISIEKCAIVCSRHPLCMSYNFCVNRICELNSEDILLMSNASKDDPMCVYGGMKNESKPACQEIDEIKLIQDDRSPGVCAINNKRRDGICSPWEYFEEVIDARKADKMEFERPGLYLRHVNRSVVLPPFHGGVACVFLEETLEHLVKPEARNKFLKAKDACEQIGGRVFDRLNGTYEQMRFLCDNIATYNMWFGLNDTAVAGDFRDWDGKLMNDVIKWATVDGYNPDAGVDFVMFDCHRWRNDYNPDIRQFYNKHNSFFSDVVCDMLT